LKKGDNCKEIIYNLLVLNWNELFFRLIDRPENHKKWARLASLGEDFVYAAEVWRK
jgi:hypothetical protein